MSVLQEITVRGESLGSSLRREEVIHGRVYAPPSTAYFCPACGEVWALVKIGGARYHVYTLLCERHSNSAGGWMTELPGSLWIWNNHEFTESLPPEVLLRETELCLNAWKESE